MAHFAHKRERKKKTVENPLLIVNDHTVNTHNLANIRAKQTEVVQMQH